MDPFDEIDPMIDCYSSNIARDNQLPAIAYLSADEMCISHPNLSREEISSDDNSDWEDPGQERSAFDLFDFDGWLVRSYTYYLHWKGHDIEVEKRQFSLFYFSLDPNISLKQQLKLNF